MLLYRPTCTEKTCGRRQDGKKYKKIIFMDICCCRLSKEEDRPSFYTISIGGWGGGLGLWWLTPLSNFYCIMELFRWSCIIFLLV